MSDTAGLTVVVGGGGVGKTTTCAALGLAHAKSGRRALVVTVDPARRLADALGVQVGTHASRVVIDGAGFSARMPDSRTSTVEFAKWLFQDEAALERVTTNPLFRELKDALAGMHELVCVAIVDHELRSGRYDEVVLDTSPSRHALDFLDYPGRLSTMLEGHTLRFMGTLAARAARQDVAGRPDRGLLAWGRRRIEGLVGMIVGADAIRSISDLFVEVLAVRERWGSLLDAVRRRLFSETRYLVVTESSGASLNDAEHLLEALGRRRLTAGALLVNRMLDGAPAWVDLLATSTDGGGELAETLRAEYAARAAQCERGRERAREIAGGSLPVIELPEVTAEGPQAILRALARRLPID